MMFLDCPAYLDQEGAIRCGLPAEVQRRFIMRSTDGPLESAMIRCPAGHWFNGPIEALTWDGTHKREPGAAANAASARRDSLDGSDDGHARATGRLAAQNSPGKREQDISRPNGAPAYYLGRPAAVWITALRPRRGPTPTRDPMAAAVSGGNPTRDPACSSTGDSQSSAPVTVAACQVRTARSASGPGSTQHPSQRTRADAPAQATPG